MELIKLYRLEIWDGGDRHYPSGFYLKNEQDAKAWKEENKHGYYSEITLKICDNLQDLKNSTVEKIREQALAKLSKEERNALGF